ncbi:hypothetical protein [Limnoraphis robusta]|uniref:Uncharacterized protein n=1 Tax=Limnoraphis robusta CCNP1315 TaxID=3110306 RepID=A0ABU5U6Y8_9CYAN|nr:hypothetical protein [Limnoraphis robusta]MEA5499227.1 hypothetical protein [Limnoraphis robusta BA-68 BA1]MEA5522982.1 hypothetical protein [Limnoraphis robusta CCNP1315]
MITDNNPQITAKTAVVESEPPMLQTDLILDDGESVESKRHCFAMNVFNRV